MPVFTPQQLRENPELHPQCSAFGIMNLPRGKTVEPHFHDCDEWWIITRGHARIMTEGEEQDVEEGAMVFTAIGDDHAVIEVYRDVEGVWFEGPLHGRRRRGHLHHPEDD